jgi:uncharacterized protein YdaU (DUF1376 family)
MSQLKTRPPPRLPWFHPNWVVKGLGMHYYTFNIGDYRRDTFHLTLLEHGVYRQLIDTYYLNERPLPVDTAVVMRTHSARTKDEKAAVLSVLENFFLLTDEGWIHRGCEKTIEKYREKSEKARVSAESRWCKRNANASETQCELDANHKPITNNHKPIIKPPIVPQRGEELFDDFWKKYPKKTGKGAALKAWLKLSNRAETLELIVQALKWQKTSEQWTRENGQFIPNPATYINQARWLDDPHIDVKFKAYESPHDKSKREWVEQMTGKTVSHEPDIFDVAMQRVERLK